MQSRPDEWRSFPLLQAALKDQSFDSRISTDEGRYTELCRLMGLAELALQYPATIRESVLASCSGVPNESTHLVWIAVRDEISDLAMRLRGVAGSIEHLSHRVTEI